MALEILDRVPTKPGRVLITPEDGSEPFYAVMTRADEPEQEGTPINKELLDNMTKAENIGVSEEVQSLLGADNVDDGFKNIPNTLKLYEKATLLRNVSVNLTIDNTGSKVLNLALPEEIEEYEYFYIEGDIIGQTTGYSSDEGRADAVLGLSNSSTGESGTQQLLSLYSYSTSQVQQNFNISSKFELLSKYQLMYSGGIKGYGFGITNLIHQSSSSSMRLYIYNSTTLPYLNLRFYAYNTVVKDASIIGNLKVYGVKFITE